MAKKETKKEEGLLIEKGIPADITKKVGLLSVRLEKLNAQIIETDNQVFAHKVKQDWSYNIKKLDEKYLILVANCKVNFMPEAYYEINLSYSIVYRIHEAITMEEVEKEVPRLLDPCSDVNSLLVAQISDKIVDSPLIIPPVVTLT